MQGSIVCMASSDMWRIRGLYTYRLRCWRGREFKLLHPRRR